MDAATKTPHSRPNRPIFRHLARTLSEIRFTPTRITVVYFAIGFGALYVSDAVFPGVFEDPALSRLQALKGFVEIGFTGALIFGLTKRNELQHDRNTEALERQRDELDLLHRVLRHNLRNDLTVINGFAQLLTETRDESEANTYGDRILSATDRIENYTEKAQRIRHVSDQSGRRVRFDLATEIPLLVDSAASDSTDMTVDHPDEAIIDGHPMVPTAIAEILDNAVKHNTSDQPRVTLRVDPGAGPRGMTLVEIRDNGPGIPRMELEPLRLGEESPLEHTSKLGLWFVKWAVDHSDGDLDIRTGPDGTTVRIALPTRIQLPGPSLGQLVQPA